MKPSSLSVCALLASCVTIAACSLGTELSRLQYTPSLNDIRSQRDNPHRYTLLYSFGKAPDGSTPLASLVDSRGTLYGTTARGGNEGGQCGPINGCGTIFAITTSRKEKVLHRFGGGGDGLYPASNLIDVGGLLYGTTEEGGAHRCASSLGGEGCGTVFSITRAGTEKVLHSFGDTDGAIPDAALIDVKGTLYGTTSAGGEYDCYPSSACGTVFSITTAGVENVLHSFGKGADGLEPEAGLIDVKGTLYGTTRIGPLGTKYCSYFKYGGCGTAFSITTAGKEKVMYIFGAHSSDGYGPAAGLIEMNGTLYGTTVGGGAYDSCQGTQFPEPCGTVFSITTAGLEKVLHSFAWTDGAFPATGLVNVNGTLYGTTSYGGTYGGGTIFSITKAGREKVLHSFGKRTDGANPNAALINVGGTLYGTTTLGGANSLGTVFSLTP
jgi:uncharacterized repeat protein (TIGR03803 family)